MPDQLTGDARELAEGMAKWAIEELERIPDPANAIIYQGNDAFTVAELMDDLRRLTPRGLQYLKLFLGIEKTLKHLNRAPREGWPTDIDGRLYLALELLEAPV